MIFIHYIYFFLLYFIVYSSTLLPQTTLSAGDLMMVTVNADGDKNFDFVPLRNLEASTVIKFTDAAWDSTALLTNEGTLTYTTSSIVTAGTIVSYSGSSGGEWSSSGSFNPSASGDNIIVYQGSIGSETFIYGIGWARGTSWISSGTVTSNYSFVPPGLSENDNTIINLSTTDNYQYITSNGTSGPKSTLRYLTSQSGNYNSNNSIAYTALSGSFTIGQAINGSSGFRILSSPVSGTIYNTLLEPLWTQGMTGGDATNGDANVWIYNASGASWSALSNLTTDSYTAGSGVLVYVFSDVDNDGVDDLPVYLSVPGTENSPTVSISTTASSWNLLGNPFDATIDADQLFTDNSNYNSTVYVWDNGKSGGADYLTWNGNAGDLSDGLIAPYQGFWIQSGAGGTSFNFTSSCKSSTAGSFYKQLADGHGSVSFTITSGDYSDNVFVSFMNNGARGIDTGDAYKLLPMTPSKRVVGLTYAEGNGLDISNLPDTDVGSISIPLDIMFLTLDENLNFVTEEHLVTMGWDLDNLSNHISLLLVNNQTGDSFDLRDQSEISIKTTDRGSFPVYGSGSVNMYPQLGESLFTLTVVYNTLSAENDPPILSDEFVLYPAYPNPFNPSVILSFHVPNGINTRNSTSLEIYDIHGHLVESLINKPLSKGKHSIQWKPANMPSGLYFVRLKKGSKNFCQKITFVK